MTKPHQGLSRRAFIQASGLASGAALLGISGTALLTITETARAARDSGAPLRVLGAAEALDLAAIAARIIPTTDTPGATEAGVIYFFDRALGAEMAWALESVSAFIDTLNAAGGDDHRFADLDEAAQDALLEAHEDDERFGLLCMLTNFGFFAMEKHGGNKGHVSWDLIGFKGHQGAWAPPFGHYDARAMEESGDDE